MKSTLIFYVAVVSILGGCASKLHRGVVAMKVDENIAHVGLSKDEASIGDHVQLYGNKCSGSKENKSCEKVSKGHGIVKEIINDNYIAVKFDDGVTFEEGDFIEKHLH